MTATPEIDMAAVETFLGEAVSDAAAAVSVLLTHVGDRLGLYRVMSDGTPVTAAELASRTGTTPRLVQEWLSNQTVGGYVVHDADSDNFRLPAEHAVALADESSPAMVRGPRPSARSTRVRGPPRAGVDPGGRSSTAGTTPATRSVPRRPPGRRSPTAARDSAHRPVRHAPARCSRTPASAPSAGRRRHR